MGVWYADSINDRVFQVHGAMTILGVLGVGCPGNRTMGEITDIMASNLTTGQAKVELFGVQFYYILFEISAVSETLEWPGRCRSSFPSNTTLGPRAEVIEASRKELGLSVAVPSSPKNN
jgi:hypothetical protein